MSIDDKVAFQFLVDNSVDVVGRSKMDLVLDYVSPSSLAVLGWKPEESESGR